MLRTLVAALCLFAAVPGTHAGQLLVGGTSIYRVDVQSGEVLQEFGGSAWDMELGPDGLLYVASKTRATIETYNPHSGEYLGDLLQPGFISYGFTFDPTGQRVYVSDYFNNRVRVYDVTSGTELASAYAFQPSHLEFGPDGLLYSTDNGGVLGPGHINRTSESGIFSACPSCDPWSVYASGPLFDEPWVLEFGANGTLYVGNLVADATDLVLAVTDNGATVTAAAGQGTPGFEGVYGIALSPQGTLFVTDNTADDRILAFELNGGTHRAFAIPGLESARSLLYLPAPASVGLLLTLALRIGKRSRQSQDNSRGM